MLIKAKTTDSMYLRSSVGFRSMRRELPEQVGLFLCPVKQLKYAIEPFGTPSTVSIGAAVE